MANNYTLEPFRAAHLWEMRFRDHENDDVFVSLYRTASNDYERHPAFTGRYRGQIVGAGGVMIPYPGVGEAWAIGTPLVYQHKMFFHRTVKRLLKMVVDQQNLRRIQVCVLSTYEQGQTWVEALGFSREAVLKKYSPNGADVVVYSVFPQERT